MALEQIFKRVKAASKPLALMEDERRNEILRLVARAIIERQDEILAANAHDLSRMDAANPMYDRLQLTPSRLQSIAADMRNVATLPSPLGRVLRHRVLDNGLELRRVSVPYGVIGMIYEARPNVTFDVFSLCFKSGNACVLKGGRDADETNRAETALIHDVLRQQGVDTAIVELLPATHEATAEMLSAVGYIDLCIPRGGKQLIDFVRNTARIPVIETGAGVVHCYFDAAGDTAMGSRIIENAKTRRCSVCNTLDTLLIHRSRLANLPALCRPLANHGVRLHADPEALAVLTGQYPAALLLPATDDDWDTEWLSLQMGICTVGSTAEAIAHIDAHGSGHSECIVTGDDEAAQNFRTRVDAACVYVNAPTSFTDGAQFGLGAEIGISTQKLGARGPMALEEMTTYKWLIDGRGQLRDA